MPAQLVATAQPRVFDAVMDVLLEEAKGLQPGFALRKAYELWTRQAFGGDAGAPVGESARTRARATGRVMALLEHEDEFPRAAHRLSGRLKVTRDQARYFFSRVFNVWNFEPGAGENGMCIDADDEYVRARIETLLDQIFVRKGIEAPDVVVPVERAPEASLEKWTAESFSDAQCVMVISSESVIVGESEVTAIERFVEDAMPSVLENLDHDALWIWLVDLGLESGRGQPDWHKYSNVVRLYGALAAFTHRLKSQKKEGEALLARFLSSSFFVGIRGVPNASKTVVEYLRSGNVDESAFDVHVNVEKLFNPAISDTGKQGSPYGRLVIGVKGRHSTDGVLYLPKFAATETGRSPHSSAPTLAVAYDVVRPDDDFLRAFDLVCAAAGRVRKDAKSSAADSLSPEGLILLTRGIKLFSVKQFIQSEWLDLPSSLAE